MRKYLFILPLLLLTACKTPTNISYLQDAADQQPIPVTTVQSFRLRPEDKINIVVSSKDATLVALFNPSSGNNSNNSLGATVQPMTTAGRGGSNYMIAYTVDAQGNIQFPVLGTVHVGGMTRTEVANYIQNALITGNHCKDALVTVEYVNLSISVLGEVGSPGRLNIDKDHLTILEAIAQVGDLNINGNRQNIMVMRKEGDTEKAYYLDLTNAKSLVSSPAYYLQQDDVVYVSPNDKRKRESTPNGNTAMTPSFWISVCTAIMSVTTFVITLTKL